MMANLTIVVDDQLLRSARIKAVAEGTSVNEICRLAIERYAAVDQKREQRLERLFALADQIASAPGPGWPGREPLYVEARPAPGGEAPKSDPRT
jgi:hypothetical protein